jgi:hypothetical protein
MLPLMLDMISDLSFKTVVFFLVSPETRMNKCFLFAYEFGYFENPFAAAISGLSMEEDQDSKDIKGTQKGPRQGKRGKGVALQVFAPPPPPPPIPPTMIKDEP